MQDANSNNNQNDYEQIDENVQPLNAQNISDQDLEENQGPIHIHAELHKNEPHLISHLKELQSNTLAPL